MRAVDTNVLVRLVARDDDEQAAAADEFVVAGAWVSHLVLAEALWVLTSVYALSSEQLALAVRMLLQHDANASPSRLVLSVLRWKNAVLPAPAVADAPHHTVVQRWLRCNRP